LNKLVNKLGDAELEWADSETDDFTYQCGHRRHRLTIKRLLTIDADRALFISYAYRVTRRYSDIITYQATHPTPNLQFTVSKGEGVSDLYFDVSSSHRLWPIRVSPGEQQTGVGQTYNYVIPAAVLPGQGVELYWYPWPKTRMNPEEK
jgi:hypothetical protein